MKLTENNVTEDLKYSKMTKEKLIASLQVARGEIEYLTKQSAEKSDLLGKLKAQYVTVSEAADKEYEKFCNEREELREALKAKDKRIKNLSLKLILVERLVKIIKATVNGVKYQGEDTTNPAFAGIKVDD